MIADKAGDPGIVADLDTQVGGDFPPTQKLPEPTAHRVHHDARFEIEFPLHLAAFFGLELDAALEHPLDRGIGLVDHVLGQFLIDAALGIARRENIVAHEGVFVAIAGPNLETRAEYRFLRLIGADVVGMSTVPEVIVAVHAGMRVLGLSVITDMCLPDALEEAEVEMILATAAAAEPKLRAIVRGTLAAEAGVVTG